MKNKWKTAFFTLIIIILIVVIAIIGTFIGLVGSPSTSPNVKNDAPHVDSPIFMVQASKRHLSDMVNNELQKHQSGTLTYNVDFDKDVTLYGYLGLLGLDIPFNMSFSPVVKNGDIILKEKSVHLGRISLPEEEVLKFIKKGTELPDWVIIQPDKKQIYVNLTKMKLKDRFYLKAKKINLSENDIEFNVYQK
ncbi:uncharacterized protein YpmS [Scopulibacillus darangshiensis]|uniref:Uncharacterized protein YpmS n=1 Tax=Scopulibacillus darangshiensis TaxID=442528 RepID=A0A4R2P513_9BACL|nr:uncharacterized protein YpmS [Scopulibacillus darangshiensis]